MNCTAGYADDRLPASPAKGGCWRGTRVLLALLPTVGYRVSGKEAQICKQKVEYHGFIILERHRALGHDRKLAICSTPRPNTRKGARELLGAAGFCRIWTPGFSEMARPLDEAALGLEDPLDLGSEQEKAFREIKRLLTSAPALGLPDVTQDFSLFTRAKSHTVLGVLT